MTENAAMRSSRIDASTPMVPKARVAKPPTSSAPPPNCALAAASAGNSRVHRRRIAYSPTLVITTNSAATGMLVAV